VRPVWESGGVQPRQVVPVAASLGLGAAALAVARHEPAASIGGRSGRAGVTLVAVGVALAAAGSLAWARRPSCRAGSLLALAGCAWPLAELGNEGSGSSLAFTTALLAGTACPALVAHAAPLYPAERRIRRLEPAALYVTLVGLCGVIPALAFDPSSGDCVACPRNLVAVADAPGVAEDATRAGLALGAACLAVIATELVVRVLRSSPAARLSAGPVLLPAALYATLVGVDLAHGVGRGFVSNDGLDRALWAGQATALLALAAGVASEWVRARRARAEVAHLVVELADAPAPGGLRDALARTLGDRALELLFPLGDGRHVDAHGRTVDPTPAANRDVTQLLRGGQVVAQLVHRRDLGALVGEVGRAARLSLEHERLRAEVRARVDELRASRARTVQVADAERRRLERDLHDGAQQRLVVLSLALRLLRAQVNGSAAVCVDRADADLRAALSELRELASGIFPAVLIDEGIAAAIRVLGQSSRGPVTVESVPAERLPAAVEAAAYFLVADVVRRSGEAAVRVAATLDGDCLRLALRTPAEVDLVELEDRIGAVDGELTASRAQGATTIRAEVPCAS
jgi:signal transduction histidine kinase